MKTQTASLQEEQRPPSYPAWIKSMGVTNWGAGLSGFSSWLKRKIKSQRIFVKAQSEFKRRKLQDISHDDVYGPDYFEMVNETTGKSARIMAHSIVKHLNPKTVIDMGCGAGNLISELRELGVETRGLEFSQWGLDYCRKRDLDVMRMDFMDPNLMDNHVGKFDLSISTEVAIQLPDEAAKNHIAFLCAHSDTVFFSSPPCANDRRPLSPQLPDYWIQQFARHRFELDQTVSDEFQKCWKQKGTAPWFHRRPMVFRKLG